LTCKVTAYGFIKTPFTYLKQFTTNFFPVTATNAVQAFKILPSSLFSASGCSRQQTHFLGIECTLEAEASVSNLTQYKLFTGDDKKIRFLE